MHVVRGTSNSVTSSEEKKSYGQEAFDGSFERLDVSHQQGEADTTAITEDPPPPLGFDELSE